MMSEPNNWREFDNRDGYSGIQVYTEPDKQAAGTPAIIIGGADGFRDFYAISPQTARELAAHLITLADQLEGKAE
jgi:hypothetical protein